MIYKDHESFYSSFLLQRLHPFFFYLILILSIMLVVSILLSRVEANFHSKFDSYSVATKDCILLIRLSNKLYDP